MPPLDGANIHDWSRQYPDLQVQVVTDPATLEDHRSEWNALLKESGIVHPFLDHAWISTWWECFGTGMELRVLLVRDGDRLLAIAPLVLRRCRVFGCEVRQLAFVENDHSPRTGFILGRQPMKACRAIWNWIESQNDCWDMLELNHLPDSSTSLDAIMELSRHAGYPNGLRIVEESPVVTFHGNWESWFASRNRKHRQNIRRRINRLSQCGHVEMETVTGETGLPEALEDGFRIEAAAWKERAGTAIQSDPRVRRFYVRYAERSASRGMLRLLFLTLDGRRIAFAFALCVHDRLFALKVGYDPAYARFSPYQQLCYRVFESGFAQGLVEYEFLGGNERWKLAWTDETRPHMALLVFGKSLRMRCLHAIKCRLMPLLHRSQWYVRLRDTILRFLRRL